VEHDGGAGGCRGTDLDASGGVSISVAAFGGLACRGLRGDVEPAEQVSEERLEQAAS
jgi:hypothetical protein